MAFRSHAPWSKYRQSKVQSEHFPTGNRGNNIVVSGAARSLWQVRGCLGKKYAICGHFLACIIACVVFGFGGIKQCRVASFRGSLVAGFTAQDLRSIRSA